MTPIEYVRSHETQGIHVDVPAIMLKYPKVSPDEALKILLEAKQPATVPEPAPVIQEVTPASTVEEKPGLDWSELDEDHAPMPTVEIPKEAPKSHFRLVAEQSMARGENRILPIVIGGKSPAIKWKDSPIDTASTEEWAALVPKWIDELDAKFPDLNACVLAKPNEFVYLDNDTTKEFREGYEAFSGEDYPETFTTSATDNHNQEHFHQTDLTRAMGNVKQFAIDGIDISVRQRNLYVLAEGSKHPKGGTYKVVVQAGIVPMPDKMVAYIQYLHQKAADGKSTIEPGQTITVDQVFKNNPPINCEISGPPIPFGEHDDTLYSIGCSLRARGWEYEEIYDRLVEVCQTRCENYGPHDYLEMCKAKAKSACRRPKGEYGFAFLGSSVEAAKTAPAVGIPVQPVVTELTLEEAQKMVDQANEKLIVDLSTQEKKMFQGIKELNPELTFDTVRKMVKAADLSTGTIITNWRDEFRNISQMEQGDMVMIIDGVLQEGVAFIGASAGDGKTLIALALAKAIVLGQPLFGIAEYLVPVPRNVIYLIPESSDKPFRDRCQAFKLPEDDRFLTRTISSGLPLSLDNPLLLEAVRQTKAVVFLDTVSRFITSEDENSAAQNRVLVDNIIALRAAGSPCVVVLHHAKKSGKEKGEPMTLENMLRGTGDYAAMCDTVYGIRADDRLRANGAGPLEMDIVNLKDREQVGGLSKLRLAASYKEAGIAFPVSYINKTGNLKPVDYKQTVERIEATLIQIVEADPKIPTTDIMAQTGLTRRKVTAALEGRGWHIVKGGTDGHSPWHQDKGLRCPFDPHVKAANSKKGTKTENPDLASVGVN
jgi:hypothetical protein